MADEKKKFMVVQACNINGVDYQLNDTALLTDLEAKYYIGLSLEPHAENTTVYGSAGEHKEKPIDVVEETLQFKEPQVHEADDRAALRPKRSEPAPRA